MGISARRMPQMKTFQVIGRAQPTEAVPEPKLYKMKLFAPNEVVAKSRYWYFLSQIVKAKRATGEIVSVKEIFEKKTDTIKNYGIFLRYDSRSGTHNMYKEFRDVSERRHQPAVHGHGRPAPCTQALGVRDQGRTSSSQGVQAHQHEGIPQGRPEVPSAPPCSTADAQTLQEPVFGLAPGHAPRLTLMLPHACGGSIIQM